jgi:hypothetical protein
MIVPLLLTVDFMNFNYAHVPCSQNAPPPALVRKGTYSYFDHKMAQGFDVSVVTVKQGSLSAGTRQAVVVLECDFPIGDTARAYAYDIHGNAATLLGDVGTANWGADWGARPSSIHIRFANNFLYVDSCKDSECTMREVRTYALRNGKLVKVYSQSRSTEIIHS